MDNSSNDQQNGYKEEKQKTRNTKEYRKLNNQLRWETDRDKDIYMEEICDEIMDLQGNGRYDLMYQKDTIRRKN
jgi:hypothetical protein